MNIGILCTMINGFGRRGFYNSQEIGLGRALVDMGHTVTIYKGVPKDDPADVVQDSENLRIEYIPIRNYGAHGYMPRNKIANNLDALFVFADNQLFLKHIKKKCDAFGTAFVPYFGTAQSMWTGTPKGRLTNFLFRNTTARMYKKMPVVAKNKIAVGELRRLGINDVTIGNVGIDIKELNQNYKEADRKALREKYGYSEDDIIVCSVGRLVKEKRMKDLPDIFNDIKDKKNFKLLIVGTGDQKDLILEKVRKYGIENDVQILQNIPYKDMWEIYTISDYFVNLAFYEIFGMAIMEAIYYGCSVAATNSLGPATILKNMKASRLCDTDAAIERFLLSPYPDEALRNKDAQRIVDDFSWKPTAQKFVDIAKAKEEM